MTYCDKSIFDIYCKREDCQPCLKAKQINGETQQLKADWEEEFDKTFSGLKSCGHKKIHVECDGHACQQNNKCKYINVALKDFIRSLLAKQTQEILGSMYISWDIPDGGKEWSVHLWRQNKEGTFILLKELNENFGSSGGFELNTLFDPTNERKEGV